MFTAPFPLRFSVSTTGSPFAHTFTGLSDVFLISTARSTNGGRGSFFLPLATAFDGFAVLGRGGEADEVVGVLGLAGDGEFERGAFGVGLRLAGLLVVRSKMRRRRESARLPESSASW